MKNFKIVLPGQAPIKKNSMGELWFRTGKGGVKIPLKVPIKYYSKPYQDWAKQAVVYLGNWKREMLETKEVIVPLVGTYIVTFLFFRTHKGTIDLSNLYEGAQDVMAGNAGNFLDKVQTRGGVRKIIKFDHNIYKILHDDDVHFIKNHGASSIYIVPFEEMCRTEIFFTEFNQEKLNAIFKYLYPDLKMDDHNSDWRLKL